MVNLLTTKHGVPQESVLGPLLFIIYINDIIKVYPKCNIKIFADDTLIYVSSDGSKKLEYKMNMALSTIEQ